MTKIGHDETVTTNRKIVANHLNVSIFHHILSSRTTMSSEYEDVNMMRKFLGERATDEFMNWLVDIDYFDAPAAKSHHGNFKGGLFNHSAEVATQLNNLTLRLNLRWDRMESPWVVGYLHDICKTDDYIVDYEDENGEEYEYNDDKIMDGHGDKSVIMLAGHFPLTEEEAMCIRFHMGAFTDKDQWKYYSRAVKYYPNVLYTHTADMIASQIKGI